MGETRFKNMTPVPPRLDDMLPHVKRNSSSSNDTVGSCWLVLEVDVPCKKYLETEKYVHDLERIFFWSLSRMRIEKFRLLYVLRGDGYPVVTDLKNWL